MMPEILEWVAKAEEDWGTAQREAVVTDNPNFNAVCFHAQQCAEKYLKARLVMSGVEFRKSHDLLYLLELVLTVEPSWTFLNDSLFQLTTYSVAIRYPGMDATKLQAERSVDYCRVIRKTIRPIVTTAD